MSAEARSTLKLALPIVVTQLGEVAIGAIDTAMIGRLGPQPLAAATAGVHLFFLAVVFVPGIATAVQALAAQAVGAGDKVAVRRITRTGLWATGLVGGPVALAHWRCGLARR